MAKRGSGPSQLMDLFLSVAGLLGASTDREVAALADVSPENVTNWRSGAVNEFKPQKLAAVKAGIASRLERLREQALAVHERSDRLSALEIEEGSSPGDLQRQLHDLVGYDYLGHRFLYFDPQGALAWEMLIKAGYGQDRWLRGVESCAEAWTREKRNVAGRCEGPIADALGYGRRARPRGLDVISLGPGEGDKELRVLGALRELEARAGRLRWLSYLPVDVSISLLLRAARAARQELAAVEHATVLPICADFEAGRLSFVTRLPTARHPDEDALRLVLVLGNVFGNLRDEEAFVRTKLDALVRTGDLVWVEVANRLEKIESDPLWRLTTQDREITAAETNRRVLLEGPYRRWEAALGRPQRDLDIRVWLREDDETSRIPGSCNFCHDLVIKDERRACTMLYSRRYREPELCEWFDDLGYVTESVVNVDDARKQPFVLHLLLRRR